MLDQKDVSIIHTWDTRGDTQNTYHVIRATHKPTGKAVQVEGTGYIALRHQAMELLEKEVRESAASSR